MISINLFNQSSYKDIKKHLSTSLKVENPHMIPELKKIVLSMRVGTKSMEKDSKYIQIAETFLNDIAGQKPAYMVMKKSISGFKVREGMKLGYKATLRKDKMYSFLAKLVSVILPNLTNFQGLLDKSIDNAGNLNIGIADVSIFPEISALHEMLSYEYKIGINIACVTSTNNRKYAKELFKQYHIPFYN